MKSLLRLIRFPNLLMIAFAQVTVRFGLLEAMEVPVYLTPSRFALLVFATVLIAAAGYIINDIQDLEADRINKPNQVLIGKWISENKAFNAYLILNIIGVGLGFYLSYLEHQPKLTLLFVLTSALLYIYATSWKHIAVVGNVVVSLLVGLSILLVGIFDLMPFLSEAVQTAFMVILDIAVMAALLNWLREMVKDLQDLKGDHFIGSKTLPIVAGRERTQHLLAGLTILIIILLVWYLFRYLYANSWVVAHLLIGVVGPLGYFAFRIWKAKEKDYGFLSIVLKLTMIVGILAIFTLGLT
ncbi:geranylgeranylglycerol-phosphate geranylgeranyltransferase [Croceiramulus getboli]|nr:geranylgeranylglycerol-phosphate geranylgeranyltransferase [Flavobacteriaceae bacterium YJPT1-3]